MLKSPGLSSSLFILTKEIIKGEVKVCGELSKRKELFREMHKRKAKNTESCGVVKISFKNGN